MTSHTPKSARSVVVAKDLFISKLDIGPFGQRLSNEGFAVVDPRHHRLIKVLLYLLSPDSSVINRYYSDSVLHR